MNRMSCMVLGCALLLTGPVFAGNWYEGNWAEGSWASVMERAPGHRVEVVTQKMKAYQGEVTVVDENSLTLRTGRDVITLARPEVYRVSLRTPSKRVRNALIGAAIGAGAGIALGAAAFGNTSESGETAGAIGCYGPIGAAAGAVIGAAVPTGSETLYRTERP